MQHCTKLGGTSSLDRRSPLLKSYKKRKKTYAQIQFDVFCAGAGLQVEIDLAKAVAAFFRMVQVLVFHSEMPEHLQSSLSSKSRVYFLQSLFNTQVTNLKDGMIPRCTCKDHFGIERFVQCSVQIATVLREEALSMHFASSLTSSQYVLENWAAFEQLK